MCDCILFIVSDDILGRCSQRHTHPRIHLLFHKKEKKILTIGVMLSLLRSRIPEQTPSYSDVDGKGYIKLLENIIFKDK